tara:strand:- start:1354 stop:2235 length:882 start_codon:yes stop_codon:yes gene_type:complete
MKLPNPNEVLVKNFMERVTNETPLDIDYEPLIEEAAESLKKALRKQFVETRGDFGIRMSNVGRPSCQLWMQKHKPEEQEKKPYDFIMKMLIGDMMETISVFIMKAAGVSIEESSGKCSLELDDRKINGEFDLIIDGKVWDVKSASPYSFNNKFKDFKTLAEDDTFGYVSQGFGYSEATGKPFGGWIAINKVTGEWKFVEADDTPEKREEVLGSIKDTYDLIASDTSEFTRCFSDVAETYRRIPTGSRHINRTCGFCEFKHSCWPNLEYRESTASQAKIKPWKYYTVYAEKNGV